MVCGTLHCSLTMASQNELCYGGKNWCYVIVQSYNVMNMIVKVITLHQHQHLLFCTMVEQDTLPHILLIWSTALFTSQLLYNVITYSPHLL